MSTKSILVLKSSPRAEGNSNTLANELIRAAQGEGAQVSDFSLHDMNISPCDACDECNETDGICIIKDDMQTLYPELRQADVIVLASPVYWFTYSAQLKLCIDRWYAFGYEEYNPLRGKNFALILTFGDSDLHNSGGINAIHTIESMCRYLDANLAGIVHGMANDVGDAQKDAALMEKAFNMGQKLAN